ncbi:hypothetical protein SOVF_107360 [Spinacia oleracea]|uniref:Scarecrow-like protein 23 n=1 Tax=Spinacia oleracea TaxID=3562 RepID=A0A9R0IUI2_SPIOL|nr:scarecrow-like protein 23 [Spinacia oleracea]KNA14454.1 hypothetical protein SOVF_107360 [Spinacia oleracea]
MLTTAPTTSLHLLTLLLKCADHISAGNLTSAGDLLPEIFELSSPFGSPADRVAAFFAHSLHSYLLLHFLSPPPQPVKMLTLSSQLRSFHSALQSYNSLTPFVKFSHFTANQAIFEALEGHDGVHVIDLDIMQGLQWPGLFHILASRPRKVNSVRVTGFGPSSDLLSQTGARLAEFAASLGLPFRFTPIEGKIGNLSESQLSQLAAVANEVTVVHCMHHNLYDISGSHVGTLRVLNAVRPRLVTMVEQDIDVSQTTSFMERFVEALHYYSALFDALGEGLGKDSVQRHVVEQQLFGSEIRNILAVGHGRKRINGDDGIITRWGDELIRVGFEPFSLSGSPAAQASLLLEMFPWKGYTMMEENGCLRLGWKDLPLLTASAWQPCDYSCVTSNGNILRN